MVREEFQDLQRALNDKGPITSANWTGRPSPGAQAALVKAVAPIALQAVQRMIEAEEHARSNGGPVDVDRDEALEHLRNLHQALGELIRLVNSERSIDKAISKITSLGNSSKLAMASFAAGTPVTAASVLAFSAVAGIAEMLVGNVVITVAAGGVAGNAMKDALLKSKPTQ